MITIPAQDVKRRGIGAIDDFLVHEPVHIIKNNQPMYVVLREEDYQIMMEDLTLARIEASENDLHSGQFRKGTVIDLLKELDEAETS